MLINFTKPLSVLANILALVIFMPGVAFAAPVELDTISGVIFAQSSTAASHSAAFDEINLTPQQRQKLQGVRQRRNREIKAVLNSSQRTQLAHNLRAGNNMSQAIETLNLQPEQQDLVKAIVQFTNLKMKAILSKYSLQVGYN
jgi:type II secretory pathway component PulF